MSFETLILPFDEWDRVRPIVEGVFENKMPETPERATFVAAMEGETLAGFLHIESLYHFNCVYVTPEHERSGLSKQLIARASTCIPEGRSAIWLTDRNVDHLAAAVGARYVGTYRVYRKDR